MFMFTGVDDDYDTAVQDIQSTQNDLQQYLDKQKTRLGCRVNSDFIFYIIYTFRLQSKILGSPC